MSYNSKFIYENIKEPKVVIERSPWHLTQSFIDIIGEYFLNFIDNQEYGVDYLKNKIVNEENTNEIIK
jgi:hypothetical protein